jgi:predicted negative regulator of RcsB-dependent stress response
VPRARLTRHELKARDEITTKLQTFTEIAVARKKEIIIGASALILIVLAWVGWGFYSARRNANAETQLAAAIQAFADPTAPADKTRYEKAITEADKTISSYGSLPEGDIARYYLGLSQEGLGDTAKATATLQELITRADPTTKGVAQFALAGIYQKHNEMSKAIDTLKQLSDSGGYSGSAVAYELGRTFEANKQPDQAKVYYEKVVTQFADSPFRTDAEAGLRRMGFTVPSPAPPAKPS